MNINRTLNLYGEHCTPILTKVEKQLTSMSRGDILVVNADNPCALKKIRSLCNKRGYLLEVQRIDKNDMRYMIRQM